MANPKPLVLIVDDDAMLRKSLADLLIEDNLDTVEAGTAEEALKIIEERDPQIAFLDIDLPGASGTELCRKIRAKPSGAPIKIVMLTGASDIPKTEESLAAGADSYITKPAEPFKLLSLVRDLLGKGTSQAWLKQKRPPRKH